MGGRTTPLTESELQLVLGDRCPRDRKLTVLQLRPRSVDRVRHGILDSRERDLQLVGGREDGEVRCAWWDLDVNVSGKSGVQTLGHLLRQASLGCHLPKVAGPSNRC